MFKFLGRLTTGHPWAVCLVWLVAGVCLSCVAPHWDSRAQDDDIPFLPSRCASVRGYQLLEKAFFDAPLDGSLICLSGAVAGVRQLKRKLSIVRQENQTLTVKIQPADRAEVPPFIRQQIANGPPPRRIAPRTHIAARFVQGHIEFSAWLGVLAIHYHLVSWVNLCA